MGGANVQQTHGRSKAYNAVILLFLVKFTIIHSGRVIPGRRIHTRKVRQ